MELGQHTTTDCWFVTVSVSVSKMHVDDDNVKCDLQNRNAIKLKSQNVKNSYINNEL